MGITRRTWRPPPRLCHPSQFSNVNPPALGKEQSHLLTLYTTHSSPFSSSTSTVEEENGESSTEHAHLGGRKGAGHTAQFADYRAADMLSAPRGENLHLLPPQPTEHFMASARAKSDGRGLADGYEIRSARTQRNTTCIKQGNKTSARLLPLGSPARGCSGSKFFCAPGSAVQGRSSRAPSPARPSVDFDHALPRCAPRALASTSRATCW